MCYTSLVCTSWDGDYCYNGYYEEGCYDNSNAEIVPPDDQSGGASRWACSNDYFPNEQDRIIKEYVDFGTAERPSCGDLRDDYSSTFFGMSEFNRNGYHPLAWVNGLLTTGLDNIRSDFGRAITTSNAYRCPDKNRDVGSNFQQTSRHMFGRAADLIPVGENITDAWREEIKRLAQAHGARIQEYGGTVHVQWN